MTLQRSKVDPDALETAQTELTKMAKLADKWVEHVKEMERDQMKHFNVESILEDLRKVATTGVIKLTNTMLNKHIIDANKSVIELAESIGINYADIKAGEKITID